MEIEKTLENGLVCSVDWLSFTIDRYENLESCLALFGFAMDDFFMCPRGANGYKKMITYFGYNIRVLFDGNENMGIHFDISGSAVSEFFRVYYESCFNIPTPWGTLAIDMELDVVCSLFQKIINNGHMTRLDLAIDNKYNLYYSVKELHEVLCSGRFVSKWRSWKFIEEKETSGACVGMTLYLGSRVSDIMLRVYDKRLEQNKKYPEKTHEKHVDYDWVRWELELKDDRANMAVNEFINGLNVGSLTVGILSNYFRVINFDDGNKSRCSTDIKWGLFIDSIQSLRLYVSPVEKTIEEKREWLIKQCAPTIAGVIMAQGGDFSFISECIDIHASRMNKKMRDLVTACNPDWMSQLANFRR